MYLVHVEYTSGKKETREQKIKEVDCCRCNVHAGAWTMTWAESFRGLRRGGTKETRREKMRPRVQRSLKVGIVPLVLVSLNETP